jgi:hypothetical protein
VARYYPRQCFSKYLGNDKALLDYLALISSLEQRISDLEALVEVVTGFFEIPNGDFFQTPGGDSLSLPG